MVSFNDVIYNIAYMDSRRFKLNPRPHVIIVISYIQINVFMAGQKITEACSSWSLSPFYNYKYP